MSLLPHCPPFSPPKLRLSRLTRKAWVLAAIATSVATAQSTPAPPPAAPPAASTPTLTVNARLVTLPVTVRDKKGNIVPGLTRDDFTLTEDGRPQTIRSLSVDQSLPLTLGLLVDTSRSLEDALDRERTASRGFVDSMLTQPNDKAFLLHFDHEVELLEDLTGSKEKLGRALDQLGPTAAERPADANGPDDPGSNGGGSGRRAHTGGGTTLYDAIYLAADELMRKQTGRKALLVFSDGADRGSKETLATALDAAQRADTVIYAIYFKGEEHFGGFGGPGNGGGGRRGGIGGGGWPGSGGGGYPGGGGGRRGGGGSPEEPHVDGKKIMAQIAEETGGRFFEAKKKENLDAIYAAISEELRTQYVLTYTPDQVSAATGFHKVALTVKRKDMSAQTRPGYYTER